MTTSTPAGSSRTERTWLFAACALSFCVALVAVADAAQGHLAGDFWEHAAVVRAFVDRFGGDAHHPLFDVDAATPHAFLSPYAFFWAVVARVFHVEAPDVFIAAQAVNVVALYAALFAFVRTLSPHPAATTTFAIATTLLCWGYGAWTWSGFFHVNALTLTASYPSTFAAALAFVACALAMKKRVFALVFVVAVCWLVHPMTALLASVCVVVITVAQQPRVDVVLPRAMKRRFFTVRAATVALVVALLLFAFSLACEWPLFPLFDLVTSSKNEAFDRASHVLYTHVIERVWPVAVAFVVVAVVRLRRDARDPLVWLAAACLAVYVGGAFTREGLGRAVSWFALFTQIALADVIAALVMRTSRQRVAALVVVVGTLAAAFGSCYGLVLDAVTPSTSESSARALLRDRLHGDVVIGDLVMMQVVPSMGGRVVAWRHPVYWVDDADERRADAATFMAKRATHDARVAVLRKYHVRYVLLDTGVENPADFADVGTLVANEGRYALLRVDPSIVP